MKKESLRSKGLFYCSILCLLITVALMIIMANKINNVDSNMASMYKELLIKNNQLQIEDTKKVPQYYHNNELAKKIPIITFHRTAQSSVKKEYFPNDEWVNDLDIVNEQLQYLYDNGWKTIDLDEFYCWYNKDCEFDKKTFVITIDDGDSEAYYNILPLLKKYNFKATLFAIGVSIPEKTEPLEEPTRKKLGYDKIKELRESKSLLSIESHTYNLHYVKDGKEAVLLKNEEELKKDFIDNEKYDFRYLAYPYGVYTDKMLDVTSNSNIKMAFKFKKGTYATRRDNKYEISRIKVSAKVSMDKFKSIFAYANQ